MSTFNDYVLEAERQFHKSKGLQRRGQCYMNLLHYHKPDLESILVDTVFDPYYDDANLDSFLVAVAAVWERAE